MKLQFYVLLVLLPILLHSCSEQNPPTMEEGQSSSDKGTIVYTTDSTEWSVILVKEHLLYSDAVKVPIQGPYHLPGRTEAAILRTCNYPHEERFVTSDGYTFGMPSASVSKAGSKTQYSVLGLYIRQTIIDIHF